MVKIIEGKKTVPMMGHFISLTSSPILLQIACVRACSKAKMTINNIYYFHICTYFILFVSLLQLDLSETAKHWDSFLTHCITTWRIWRKFQLQDPRAFIYKIHPAIVNGELFSATSHQEAPRAFIKST